MEDSLVAYCLCQVELGWAWRLVDEMGEVIADGCAPDQSSAMGCLLEAFDTMQATLPPPVAAQSEAMRP
jgi:hypothetical protein